MITKTQFNMIDKLFDYYNQRLFDGKLNDCMINMSRQKGAYGFFQPQNWKKYNLKKEVDKDIHEISLNPNYLDRPNIEWHSTLVHEMVHLWQQDFGKPSRSNYHNKQWARKMEEIGLIPSSTGQPGGKKTGQGMSHYVSTNGQFIEVFNRLMEKSIKYSPLQGLETNKAASRKAYKTKYECPCGNNVWGKPGLHIVCAVCNQSFEQTD
jgi:predicted SprT family Zn-dependent metalloprotease